jgi:hypothetical protein
MKIIKIDNESCVFSVTFAPYWFEKIFGIKEKVKKYRFTYSTFTFGNGGVYLNEDGEYLSNGNWIGEAIDKYRRKW